MELDQLNKSIHHSVIEDIHSKINQAIFNWFVSQIQWGPKKACTFLFFSHIYKLLTKSYLYLAIKSHLGWICPAVNDRLQRKTIMYTVVLYSLRSSNDVNRTFGRRSITTVFYRAYAVDNGRQTAWKSSIGSFTVRWDTAVILRLPNVIKRPCLFYQDNHFAYLAMRWEYNY